VQPDTLQTYTRTISTMNEVLETVRDEPDPDGAMTLLADRIAVERMGESSNGSRRGAAPAARLAASRGGGDSLSGLNLGDLRLTDTAQCGEG
jgi:hypothetical protein